MDDGGSEPDGLDDARPAGRPARPVRDDHGLLRLRPPGPDLRAAPRARPAAPPRDGVHVRPRLARPVPAREQRQPRLRGADDVVLPRCLPAGEHLGVSRVGAGREARRPEPLLPRLRPRRRGAGEHVLRRRRRPRQQAVRLGDRRHQAAARGRRGRAPAALPRAGPRRALHSRGRQAAAAEEGAGHARRDHGGDQRHSPSRADPRRPARRESAQRAGEPDQGRDRDELRRRGGVRRRRGRLRRRRSRGCPERQALRVDRGDQQADHHGGGTGLRDLSAPEDQRHRRPLRRHGLQRLRLPRRLEPRPARAQRPALLGAGAQALQPANGAHGAAARVPAPLRPGLPGAPPALRHVGAALVVPRPRGRQARHPAA